MVNVDVTTGPVAHATKAQGSTEIVAKQQRNQNQQQEGEALWEMGIKASVPACLSVSLAISASFSEIV